MQTERVGIMLPKEYGYVALVLVAYTLFNFWMARKVVAARKKYNVPYPILYANESDDKKAMLFNCVQRGHQNTLETVPWFFTHMVLGGIRHPCICAILGAFYIVTRYFYFTGYSTGVPSNRLSIGKYAFFILFALLPCTISFGISLIRGTVPPS